MFESESESESVINNPNLSPGDLVVVYWSDAEDEAAWEDVRLIEVARPPVVKTVGWFLNRDEECVRLLYSIVGQEGEDAGLQAGRSIIPMGMVKRVEKIRDDELCIIVPKGKNNE